MELWYNCILKYFFEGCNFVPRVYTYIYIPNGQALRFKRICNSNEGFERRLYDLRGFLVNRGYDKEFVEKQFGRAREVDRLTLIQRVKKSKVMELTWLLIIIRL